jgi:hypothetical protein
LPLVDMLGDGFQTLEKINSRGWLEIDWELEKGRRWLFPFDKPCCYPIFDPCFDKFQK